MPIVNYQSRFISIYIGCIVLKSCELRHIKDSVIVYIYVKIFYTS